ncbi:unnamed protein product [Angiostrongylus costaricensis]|uniref:BZIP domain-containing protein n=1 Tax=Angiostrongylus costaricensis TaxID=334426 RepID=A0A0R3PFQ2_ANGCS|nr:unnamed protein product [Angiostrongylus costaricensis]
MKKMNPLNGQILDGCSLFKEHPIGCEPFVEVDCCEKSDSVEAHTSRFDCSDPILNHDHDDFLAELSYFNQWKGDTSSFTEENSAGQLGSIGNNTQWNEIDDAIEWIEKFRPTEISVNVDSPNCFDYSDDSARKQPSDPFDQIVSLIDWEAWNCYLDNADVDLDECTKTSEDEDIDLLPLVGGTVENTVRTESSNSANSCECGSDPTDLDFSADAKLNEKIVVPKSGPLTWLPSMDNVYDCDRISSSEKSSTVSIKPRKRRGVKMKPLGDDETNHRRLLNRKAAFRYRERKRMKQNEQKRELEHLISYNSQLKRHLRLVRMEIDVWKEKINWAKDVDF